MPRDVPFTRIFDNEYFTSNQSFVYIGDTLVDEVTSLQWNLVQNKTPVYGYSSQLFDATTMGHVLVQGQFTINFKEAGYLWAILSRWHNIDNEFLNTQGIKMPGGNKSRELSRGRRDNSNRPIIGSNGTKVERASIERIVQGDVPKGETYNFYDQLAGYATADVDSPRDKTFEDIVEAFEDEIWKTNDNNELINQLRRVDDNLFDNFDIYVVLGNYANPRANHTARKLVGVRLISTGIAIEMDDRPLQEAYQFIARSVV